MKIAIKNPAPRGANLGRWGDFHFGKALEAALVRQGAEVVQHFWPEWDLHDDVDAVIWLRGKRRCSPRPGVVNAIWILSHPSTLTKSELDGFDIVYAASSRLATELHESGVRGVELMRQCTDGRRFRPTLDLADDDRKGLLFVASSRGVRRPILDWALASGLKPNLVGQGWQQVGLGDMAQLDHVRNSDLPAMYSAARYGMNDHWGDMAHYQMVNNRIFDCLACGLPVISDGFPELAEVVGDGVWMVDGPRSFKDAYWSMRLDYAGARAACNATWEKIGEQYTFDARARTIMGHLQSRSPSPHPVAVPSSSGDVEQLIADLINRAGGLSDDPTMIKGSLLHVFPRKETAGLLSAIPSLSVLSAGIGPGPWNVKLDHDQDELGERKFNIIFVEDNEQALRCGKLHEVLKELMDRLKPGGLISTLAPQLLHSPQSDARMAMVSRKPLIFRRTVEHLDLLGSSTHLNSTRP